jgi:hypothetical protein
MIFTTVNRRHLWLLQKLPGAQGGFVVFHLNNNAFKPLVIASDGVPPRLGGGASAAIPSSWL